MTANAEILLDEHKGVLTVPENAVTYDSQKNASVQVPDKKQKDGTRKVAVTVGLSNGSRDGDRERAEGRRPGGAAAVRSCQFAVATKMANSLVNRCRVSCVIPVVAGTKEDQCKNSV